MSKGLGRGLTDKGVGGSRRRGKLRAREGGEGKGGGTRRGGGAGGPQGGVAGGGRCLQKMG